MGWNNIMFDNIGAKIQSVAKVLVWVNIAISIIYGIILFFYGLAYVEYMWYLILLAPIVIIVGCIMSWLSVLTMYGLGKLIEDVGAIREQNGAKGNTSKTSFNSDAKPKSKEPAPMPTFNSEKERWEYEISRLDTKELKERHSNNYEWADEYRDLCYKEIQKREANGCDNASFKVTDKNTIICNKCNFEQPANRKVCWHCGIEFTKEATAVSKDYVLCEKCGADISKDEKFCHVCGEKIVR